MLGLYGWTERICARLEEPSLGAAAPTREDVASVKGLAERLRGANDAETLSNILEWQERNIAYWWERGYLLLSMIATLPCLVPVGALLGWLAGGAAAMPAFASALPVLALLFIMPPFALVYMLLLYRSRARSEPGVRGRLRRVGELAKLTFQPSYPLRRLLELRMGGVPGLREAHSRAAGKRYRCAGGC